MASETEPLSGTTVPLADRAVVHQALNTMIIFTVLVSVWAGLRLYARRVRYTPLNVEDALFYISVACFYGMVVGAFILIYFGGVGYHMDQLHKWHVARLTQSMLVIQILYGGAMCGSKWSILWMLKRIFVIRPFQISVWVIMGFQLAWVVMTVLIGFLICRPITKNWDPTVPGKCADQIAGYTAVSAVNVVIDVAMCILPLPVIYKLRVKKPYKAALLGIFGIGIVSVVFSVIRLLSLRNVDFGDFSWTVPTVITWTYAETGVILLVACSPLLRPIFDVAFRRFLGSHSGSRNELGPSQESRNFGSTANMQSKSTHMIRNGFISVGGSEESLQLGDLRSEGRVQTKAVASRSVNDIESHLEEGGSDDSIQMGITVKNTVTQTVSRIP